MGKPTPLEGLQCEAFAAGMEGESCKYTFPERDHNSFAPSAAGSASWFLLQGKQVLIYKVQAFPLQRLKKYLLQFSKKERDLVPLFNLCGPGHWFYLARNVSLASKQGMSSLVPPDIPASLDGHLTPGQETRAGESSLALTAIRRGKCFPCSERVTQKPNQQTKHDITGTCKLSKFAKSGSSCPTWVIYYQSPF